MTFRSTLFIRICDYFRHAEGLRVKRCLRNESIRKWYSKKSSNARGQAEEENIPMESRWLPKRKLRALCYQ